jgi:hypothetical protein
MQRSDQTSTQNVATRLTGDQIDQGHPNTLGRVRGTPAA